MRTVPIALFALSLTISPSARAEDCTKRADQAQQIECLQRTVEALQRQLERLLPKRSVAIAGVEFELQGPTTIEALIEAKIREALEPKVHLLPK